MKRLSTIMMCLFAMMAASLSAKAQEVTVTLIPGCTWISYPNAETMDIATALGDFVPMEGDVIKSQYSQTIYNNGRWRGRLQQFTPGLGYHYYSMRGEPVSFVFASTAPQLTVTTAEPTDITATSAMSGGSITSNDGSYIYVLQKGICWATHPNPMVMNDFFTENGSGAESFTAEMTDLSPNTVYYVRAYAVTENGTNYGEEMSFITLSGIPTLTTAEISSVTGTSAVCGGNITDDGGLSIIARGVCWGTSPNPTIDDLHTIDSCGTGIYSSRISGLNPNTTYYVRAYAINSYSIFYGNQLSFTTLNLEYVDLALPSGTLWATCNVGASFPEDYGDYIAWGETEIKYYYDWSNYRYCHGNYVTLTKYCSNSRFGYNNYTDNLTTLQSCDDAATVNWGGNWRIPTTGEWQELIQNTTRTWTTQNGVNGWIFIASNGNSLFLPASGYRSGSDLYDAGNSAYYWSSKLYVDFPSKAWLFYFDSDNYNLGGNSRCCGQSIRPVCSPVQK